MKHWFKDQHFRSLLKNSGYLAVSRVIAAVCSLATLAFGIIVLTEPMRLFASIRVDTGEILEPCLPEDLD